MRVPDANGLDKVEAMKQNYYKLRPGLYCHFGERNARRQIFHEEGLNVIHLPRLSTMTWNGSDLRLSVAIDIATQ